MRIALFCVMAERTKHIHAQRSFRFLAERHKTLADGTLAKRLVGETTGHPAEISPCHHRFPLLIPSVFVTVPLPFC